MLTARLSAGVPFSGEGWAALGKVSSCGVPSRRTTRGASSGEALTAYRDQRGWETGGGDGEGEDEGEDLPPPLCSDSEGDPDRSDDDF